MKSMFSRLVFPFAISTGEPVLRMIGSVKWIEVVQEHVGPRPACGCPPYRRPRHVLLSLRLAVLLVEEPHASVWAGVNGLLLALMTDIAARERLTRAVYGDEVAKRSFKWRRARLGNALVDHDYPTGTPR